MSDNSSFLKAIESWKGSPDFDLVSIRKVLKVLGEPQDSSKSVHIAGTNGKGSTSTMIAAGLSASSLQVGLNTSPHLVEFGERLIINGAPVDEERLGKAIVELRSAMDETGVSLSFHEGVTTLAFLLFKDLDFGVYETGLGGRLDSSNVLKHPEVCVITTIGRDHEHILGDSLEKIAYEKAGIIKQGGTLVLGAVAEGPREVILSVAKEKSAKVLVYGQDFSVEALHSNSPVVNRGKFESKALGCLEIEPSLPGSHQLHNAALATAALKSIGISDKYIQEGVSRAYWPARFEFLSSPEIRRPVVVDCAHNVDGFKVLQDSLKQQGIEQYEVALGFLQTKRWHEMLDIVKDSIVHWNIVEAASNRKVEAELISSKIQENSRFSCSDISIFASDYEAFIKEVLYRDSDVPLIICGSIYMIGELYRRIPGRRKHLF